MIFPDPVGSTIRPEGVVFHQAGQMDIAAGTRIEDDQPCPVLIDQSKENTEVAIASPEARSLSERFDFVSADDDIRSRLFQLPAGESDAGRSLTQSFSTTTPKTGSSH